MRQARLKARTDQPVGYYHCVSRVVERRFLWEDQDLERVKAVIAAQGKLSMGEYLRCRVRYFVDGAVLGSKAFVDGVFVANRARFGPKRKEGGRKLRYLSEATLYSLRDLEINPVG